MLWKKVLRDLKENKGAYLASTVVIIIGLMVFSAFSVVVQSLNISQLHFYQNQNFADGFAQVAALPPSEINNLKNIKGIADIQGRIVKDVRVLLPDRNGENVYLRLIAFDTKLDNPINGVRLSQGIPLNNKESNIWIDNKFFEANSLNINSKLDIIAGGKKRTLEVVGVGQSPEFVYALRTVSELYPSPETFGIAFIPLELMALLFPEEQAYNDLIFTTHPGADFDELKSKLEDQLRPYGLKSVIPRADQVSHLLLTSELDSLEAMSKAFPFTFLSIAAMIMYIMLKRLIQQQRGQIGILKAFGYTHREIIFHYLSYSLIIGLFGGIAGGVLGIMLSQPLTSLYLTFFNMPEHGMVLSTRYLFFSVVLSLVFSLFAGYMGCKKILTLEPAEAMRPPAPAVGGKTWLEKIPLLWDMLTVQGMMAVRNLSRNKGRALFVFLGIMFCFAITVFTWSMNDMIQKMMFDQYEKIEVYDVKMFLTGPQKAKAISQELHRFPGVNAVEALAEVPVLLKHNWHEEEALLLGISGNSDLYNILDSDENKINLPDSGLVLSERLAALLEAEIGTLLTVGSPMLNSSVTDKQLPVTGIIPQYVGVNAYMDLAALQDYLKQGELATSFIIKMDEKYIPLLQEKYKESDIVESVDAQGQRQKKLEEMMASYGSMIYLYALIGVIIGFSIIYSTTLITVSERSRELASMLVLGMTPAEAISVVTFEQWFLAVLAMIAGIPLSKIMTMGISKAISNDVFTIPTILTLDSFLLAFLVTSLSVWVAQMVAGRKVKQLSLVEVLKSGE